VMALGDPEAEKCFGVHQRTATCCVELPGTRSSGEATSDPFVRFGWRATDGHWKSIEHLGFRVTRRLSAYTVHLASDLRDVPAPPRALVSEPMRRSAISGNCSHGSFVGRASRLFWLRPQL
jgi:hypothetical protein